MISPGSFAVVGSQSQNEGSKAIVNAKDDFAKRQRIKNDSLLKKKRLKSVYNIATSRYNGSNNHIDLKIGEINNNGN
jgi:hypothetical protein